MDAANGIGTSSNTISKITRVTSVRTVQTQHAQHGLIRMCAWCHKVYNDMYGWQRLHPSVVSMLLSREYVTHGICPECKDKIDKQLNKEGR